MAQSYFLLGFCLSINIMIMIIFFSKKRLPLFENGIYIRLMIMNFLCITFEFLCNLSSDGLLYDYREIVVRLFLIGLMFYGSFLTIYTLVVAFNNSEKNLMIKRTFLIMNSVLAIPVLFLGMDFRISYVSGLAVNYMVTVQSLYIVLVVSILIFKTKSLKRKFIPIVAYIVLMILGVIINKLEPTISTINSIETFVVLLMYFTIENPDLKMIQELEVAREQADKANHAKTDFLSSMSHEIRTPLNAIVGFSDCIIEAQTLDEAQENAKDIVNASQTLLEIVTGILDISKIEAGKIEIVNTKYNAPETFEELAKLITPRMNEKGLDFTYSIAPDLPQTLFGDYANLKKIVTNLLSNACKYTEKGYVHYEVSCINTHNVSKLIISVEDSGRGIKKENIDKMFTKFQRLDEDRNTTIEGTGLGLAITKQLIELMGGRIIVHTIYGQGSKFTVVLNQKITQADAEIVKKVKDTLDLTNVRIMLVDDTALNLKVASKLLGKYGANQLVTCASGFECLDRIKRGETYDLILLDDMMPKMSGVETLKQLKAIPGYSTPTVALTANAISGMREKYLADGFDDYLAKPIEKDQMILVINQLLGRSVTEDISQNEIQQAAESIPSASEQSQEVADKTEEKVDGNDNPNPDVIPVEENIEEILGDQLDMNYKEKTMTGMKPIQVDSPQPAQPVVSVPQVQPVQQVEVLDEPVLISNTVPVQNVPVVPQQPVQPINTVPVQSVPVVPQQPVQPINTVPVQSVTPVTSTSEKVDRSYLERCGVDVNHALELLGDMEMYNMTISDFMKEVENKWNRIVQYKNENNMPDYAIEVHSLKSDCKYLGFMRLADVAYEHELKSKENDSSFVNGNFARLEEEYKKVLEIARTYVANNPVE